MLHHPLEHVPGVDKRLMRGAASALTLLGDSGADIVLSGHLHTWHARPFARQARVLFVQAGTGLSTRVRGQPNDFNLLSIDGAKVRVEQWVADKNHSAFSSGKSADFEKIDDIWHPAS